jgi:hypothetical protein
VCIVRVGLRVDCAREFARVFVRVFARVRRACAWIYAVVRMSFRVGVVRLCCACSWVCA